MDANRRIASVFDSTLRDGSQGEGISFSLQDKIRILKALDDFGVDYIEAGNPCSNPKDAEFFDEIKKIKLNKSKVCAFGSTVKFGTDIKSDENIKKLLDADTPVVSIVGKAWDFHVEKVLKISLDENLEMIKNTVSYLKSFGKEVIFDAEHFFDGYMSNPEYAISVLKAATDGGADILVLCDTNGGMIPKYVEIIVETVKKSFADKTIGIHCHNDSGCAVANSISAVYGGATHIQGTMIGFGERCGNADLGTIIANLTLKSNYDCGVKLEKLSSVCQKIAEISNVLIKNNHPYIGKSAFAHKGGMHIDAVQKITSSFEHVEPDAVGNERRFLLSEVSGRGTVLPILQRYKPELDKNSPETLKVTNKLKELEYDGYQFEAAEASFDLLIRKQLGLYEEPFNIAKYNLNGAYPFVDGEQYLAAVEVKVNGKSEPASSLGNGPVNALDTAMRQVLEKHYPELSSMYMSDIKVRFTQMGRTTDAKVRVLIESTDEDSVFTTVGVSSDIVGASFTALIDSYEYEIIKSREAKND